LKEKYYTNIGPANDNHRVIAEYKHFMFVYNKYISLCFLPHRNFNWLHASPSCCDTSTYQNHCLRFGRWYITTKLITFIGVFQCLVYFNSYNITFRRLYWPASSDLFLKHGVITSLCALFFNTK